MTPFSLRALIVLVLALPPASAAQDPPPPPPADAQAPKDPPRRQEFVEVEGELPAVPALNLTALKSPLSLQSTPASVSVVSRPLFESQAARVMGDVLRNASGVQAATGFGVFDFFVIRGFDSLGSGLVLTDGVAEPESTFYPLYNVRQVEVLKGPAAFLYGGNPLAGAVHLVRKQPRAGQFADLHLLYGRFQTAECTLDANLSRADGSLALRFNGLSRRSDGHRDGMDSSQHGLNPALTWRPGPDTRLTLNAEYVRSEFQPDSGLPIVGGRVPDVPRTRSYQSPFDRSEQDLHRLRVEAEHRFGSRVTLRNRAYYTRLAWNSDGTLIAGAFPDPFGGIQVARSLTLLDDRQRLLGNQLEALVSFSTGKVRHELLAGLEVSRLEDDFTLDVALLPTISLSQPVETARQPLFLLPGFSTAGDARSRVVAPYLVDHVGLSDRVQLLVGARLDDLDYDEEVTATRRDATRLSPLGGVVFSPSASLSFYASAAGAFAPPSTLVVGEREPEESRQVEVGAKRTFLRGRGLATLALYHLEKDNVAIPDASGVTRQIGDQRSRGVEAELSAELGGGWFAFGAYSFTDAELKHFAESVQVSLAPPAFAVLDRSGNAPPFAARHLASLWGMKQFARGLGLGLGARYVGRQFIAEDNAYAIDSHLTFDAMASYRRGRWRLSLNLKNLTDREYETRGFGAASVIPAPPFTIFARLELGLGTR